MKEKLAGSSWSRRALRAPERRSLLKFFRSRSNGLCTWSSVLSWEPMKNLWKSICRLVLQRATRWNAILLIDEADVYVRARADDIQQNAIVGVFLRVLEYYRGVLFLTSNRETVIDDAIMSRATAWLKYSKPDANALAEIWRVLSKQYEVALSELQIAKLVEVFLGITGRNVKNLLKLSKLLAMQQEKVVSVEMIQHVSKFLALDRTEVKPNDQDSELL